LAGADVRRGKREREKKRTKEKEENSRKPSKEYTLLYVSPVNGLVQRTHMARQNDFGIRLEKNPFTNRASPRVFLNHTHTLEGHSRLLFLASKKSEIEDGYICMTIYKKLLKGSFSPKFLSLFAYADAYAQML
jgi:hypothetical protein